MLSGGTSEPGTQEAPNSSENGASLVSLETPTNSSENSLLFATSSAGTNVTTPRTRLRLQTRRDPAAFV
jgi:hypothetical protein